MTVQPTDVHKILSDYMLADGFDLVLDLKKSKGCRIYDSRSGKTFFDCFSFFASAPLGCNHPALNSPEFIKKMGEVAIHNPTNSDVYTTEMAEFVDSFTTHAVPNDFQHLFFIAGGALAVENGIKTAFDWKIRKNISQGKAEIGQKVIHFKEAFHGRTGYTLSMTNTHIQNKIKYFPKFNWPRITNPKIRFPLNAENLQSVKKLEDRAVQEIKHALENYPDDIAALVIEPIQGEGGDNHFRKEFFHTLRQLCDKHDMMFMIDEVQTGVGVTGKMWAYQHFDFTPDIIAFGKKTQICGIMVGKRVDEIKDNVFKVSSRLNSTWGGNLIDMVRCQKYLEVIKEESLVKNAELRGKQLLQGLEDLEKNYSTLISNTRGRGLFCAFDLPSPQQRDSLKNALYKHNMIILGCGPSSIRFRPPLIITQDEVNEILLILEKALKTL